MDWYKLFEEQINKWLGILIGIVMLAIIGFLRKIPKYAIEKMSEARNIKALSIGGKISDQIDIIEENSFAMYNHIIYYENGGKEIAKDKIMHMTIKWERIGHLCEGCMLECPFKNNIPKLKNQWKHEEVTEGWRKVIVRTVNAKGKFNNTSIGDDPKQIDEEVKDIWNKARIFRYMEVVIKHKRKGFYTLGLSYCDRLQNANIPEGVLYKSINKLKELL